MKRVLIIDDHSSLRELVRDILENMDQPLSIEEEENGLDALVNLECRDYDLLICDVKMPECDGFEVVKTIRNWSWNPNVPVIMLTAEADPESIAKGATLGATSYLTKPFNAAELEEAVKTFLA
jgi:CheY-like chemotaxis protein